MDGLGPLLERDHEMDALTTAFEDARTGRGRVVRIEGLPGSGKTELLRAARTAAATRGMTVAAARATGRESEIPLGVVRQLFEKHAARTGGGLLEGDDLVAVARRLAERGPLLVAIDDVHLADDPSLGWLAALAEEAAGLSVAVVITVPKGVDLPRTPGEHVLALRPLSPAAGGRLIEEGFRGPPEPAFAATCHNRSGGNPLLLRELVATLVDRGVDPVASEAHLAATVVPERIVRWVSLRLDGCGDTARGLAHAAAVLADRCSAELAAALAGQLPPEAERVWGELVSAGIQIGRAHV